MALGQCVFILMKTRLWTRLIYKSSHLDQLLVGFCLFNWLDNEQRFCPLINVKWRVGQNGTMIWMTTPVVWSDAPPLLSLVSENRTKNINVNLSTGRAWEKATNQIVCSNIRVGKHQNNQMLHEFGSIWWVSLLHQTLYHPPAIIDRL